MKVEEYLSSWMASFLTNSAIRTTPDHGISGQPCRYNSSQRASHYIASAEQFDQNPCRWIDNFFNSVLPSNCLSARGDILKYDANSPGYECDFWCFQLFLCANLYLPSSKNTNLPRGNWADWLADIAIRLQKHDQQRKKEKEKKSPQWKKTKWRSTDSKEWKDKERRKERKDRLEDNVCQGCFSFLLRGQGRVSSSI